MFFFNFFEDKRSFTLLDKLANSLQDKRFADIKFEVEGKFLIAHKIILAGNLLAYCSDIRFY